MIFNSPYIGYPFYNNRYRYLNNYNNSNNNHWNSQQNNNTNLETQAINRAY